jgi:arginine decarboxylase
MFSTSGSTMSVHAAILAVAGPGQKILVARNVHKSVLGGLILSGAAPVYLRPRWDRARQIAHPATADDVAAALKEHPDAAGVLIITPTEYGTGADVAGVAEVCHRHGVPVIVDEAWGAHFPFHPELPTAAMAAGADLSINSLHKSDGGLMQSSMLHVRGDLVDRTALTLWFGLLATTSASSLLYGSIDGWRRRMVRDGHQLIDGAIARVQAARRVLDGQPGLAVLDRSVLGTPGVDEFDPLKLCVEVDGLGISGFQAVEWLRAEHQVDVQLGDSRRLVAALTYADDEARIGRLVDAVMDLARRTPAADRPPVRLPELHELDLESVMPPREAFFADTEQISAHDAVGRVAAEMVSPYPPGVPAIAPGERINDAVVEYLRSGVDAGVLIPDAVDPSLKTFRVVR